MGMKLGWNGNKNVVKMEMGVNFALEMDGNGNRK